MELLESTLFLQLRRLGGLRPEQIALSTDDRVWTYNDLCDQAERLASGFRAMVRGNERPVAVISENRAEVLMCWLAGSRSGITTSMLNPRLTPLELSKMLARLNAGAVVTDADDVDRVLEAKQLAGIDPPIVVLGEQLVEGCVRFDELSASARTGVRIRTRTRSSKWRGRLERPPIRRAWRLATRVS